MRITAGISYCPIYVYAPGRQLIGHRYGNKVGNLILTFDTA